MPKLILYASVVTLFFCTAMIAQMPEPTPRNSVADINGMAITLVKPAFPETAVAAQADGSALSLLVIVDENGNVVSATCSLNCHPMLKDAAELAAATSRFRPLVKDGRAVKYDGILIYTFVVDRVDWFRFGSSFESVRQFDNISLGPAAAILSAKYAEEKSRLLALDAKGTELETRWKIMREVEGSLRSKLKDGDLWRFEIGMALRMITFWTMAGGPTKRDEMQAAIDDLPKIISRAPKDIPAEILDALKTVSKYRVAADMPERELRREISEITRGIWIQ